MVTHPLLSQEAIALYPCPCYRGSKDVPALLRIRLNILTNLTIQSAVLRIIRGTLKFLLSWLSNPELT